MNPIGQRDPKWSSVKLGTSDKTIGSHGCTISSLAYLLETTPDAVNTRLLEVGGYADGNLVVWSKLRTAFPRIEEVKRVTSYNNDEVANNLPCLVEVDGARIGAPRHWVVYVGNQQMMDPWFANFKTTSFYPPVGYAIIKLGTIDNKPMDIRLRILDENNVLTEGDLRGVLGSAEGYKKAIEDKNNSNAELEKLRVSLSACHTDLKTESEANQAHEVASREEKLIILKSVADALGSTQDLPRILQEIQRLISVEDKVGSSRRQIDSLTDMLNDLNAEMMRKDAAYNSLTISFDSLKNEQKQFLFNLRRLNIHADTFPAVLEAFGDLLGMDSKPIRPFVGRIIDPIINFLRKLWP